jgi:hypothetical protein
MLSFLPSTNWILKSLVYGTESAENGGGGGGGRGKGGRDASLLKGEEKQRVDREEEGGNSNQN